MCPQAGTPHGYDARQLVRFSWQPKSRKSRSIKIVPAVIGSELLHHDRRCRFDGDTEKFPQPGIVPAARDLADNEAGTLSNARQPVQFASIDIPSCAGTPLRSADPRVHDGSTTRSGAVEELRYRDMLAQHLAHDGALHQVQR